MGHGQSREEEEQVDIPEENPQPRRRRMVLRGKPTLGANPDFDIDAACEELQKSMKGWGTDEDTLMLVLTKHSNQQRQEIKEKYMAMYGEDLVDQIKGEVDGHFQDLILALLTPTMKYEVECLYYAMKGAGTSEDVLIEVLVGKSNEEIAQIKEKYQEVYEESLDEKVSSDCSGIFQNIIRSLLSGARDEGWGDRDEADADAQELVDAGVADWGTDESKFNQILCSKSFPHLSMVFRKYAELSGQDIVETLESEFSGSAKDALVAIVKEARDTPQFFAERLRNAMEGVGTTDTSVIRILVTRSEIDLGNIKDRYQELYEETLVDRVKGETGGDYEQALCLVLGERPE